MPRSFCRLTLLLILLLPLPAWALSGPQTAQLLNQRLAATPAQCIGGKPPHACSGVLLLPMAEGHPQPFWHHDAEAQERGTERFLFLRKDLAADLSPGKVGYILHDGFTARGQRKAYEVVEDGNAAPGELMVRNWPEDAPAQLAVQALYYDMADPDSLLRAQRGQLDYFKATGQWLPLVRFAAGTFGFSVQDQLYSGYQVAARLNARYADTTPCLDGRSGYYCNGVFVRTVDMGDYSYRIWNPSPNSEKINGVSFSYLRKDVARMEWLVYSKGYVIRELSAPAKTPIELGCLYPEDAATNSAPEQGACTFRQTCDALGITSVDSWRARYESEEQRRHSCALSTTAEGLALLVAIRAAVPRLDQWNEAMMRAWPPDIGEQLPIEAFIHSDISIYEHSGLADARYIQRDYLKHAGRYLPLLKIELGAAQGKLFSYDPQEQDLR